MNNKNTEPDWVKPWDGGAPKFRDVIKAIPKHICCKDFDKAIMGEDLLGPDAWAQAVYDPKRNLMVDIHWVGHRLYDLRKPMGFCPWCGAKIKSWSHDEFLRQFFQSKP
jgi:hypothetical protein